MSAGVRHHVLAERRVYRLTGADGRDLLQRISTADLAVLAHDRPVATLLTNEKGRVVDLVGVAMEAEGALLLAGLGDDDGRILRWLERFIIMEDVTITDLSEQWTVVAAYEPKRDGSWALPAISHRPTIPVTIGRNALALAVVPTDGMMHVASRASELGTSVAAEDFHRDRISAGVPWPGAEIGDHRHPLEMRLRSFISFTKGCYIGQEVIARLDAYRKVQTALTRFTGALTPDESVPIPLATADGNEAGLITSVAAGPSSVCGLGFVRIGSLSAPSGLLTPRGITVTPIDTDPSEQIYS